MTTKFINCDFSSNGIDGVSLGKNSKAEFINTTTNNNGRNGVTFYSESEVSFNGLVARGNRAFGVQEIDTSLIQEIGLPVETEIQKFKDLIFELRKTNIDLRSDVIKASFLASLLANTSNASTIITNIMGYVEKLPPIF